MKRFIIYALSGFFFLCSAVTIAHADITPEIKEEAVKASLLWLDVVDQGLYDQSWEQTDQLFQQKVTKEQWIKQLTDIRPSLGKVNSRMLYDAGYFGKIPEQPDMEMVVVQFQTSFQNKILSYETISHVRMKGGSWKVAGYYITDSVDIKSF